MMKFKLTTFDNFYKICSLKGYVVMNKTNAMRLLTAAKIKFDVFEYEFDEDDLAGTHAADFLKIPYSTFYKTLVLKGSKNGTFVCCIPVDKELDLKKAAAAFNDKSCEMIHVKDLLGIAGYMRGACTPVGMKKNYPVFIHSDINTLDLVYLSAGARGASMRLAPADLISYTHATVCDIAK